ncbi:MAG: HipA domain-containing protein [Pseudomonadota bacterium]|nr:HipA domain-containing protein [Pseudomonadota bacterium]
MAADVLDIFLGDRKVGAITGLGGDRTVFTFDDDYADDPARPTLSLSFKDAMGDLIRDQRRTQTRLSPFFSNLLPEGPLRDYLAERAGVNVVREFYLLWALGGDLPGAIIARGPDGEEPTPALDDDVPAAGGSVAEAPMRFSLAGVQLKFSAVEKARGGLTIPVTGVGGSWIVKLPSTRFVGVSENEYSMMTLAKGVGIDVPDIQLLALDQIAGLPDGIGRLEGAAYAIRRFDRTADGDRVHMEDFAQVFGVYPADKYKQASYRAIAKVMWLETGEAGITEFIRRLVFNALIGNADMHLKNWSLLYADGITPALSPAYDFVSTLAYIPDDKAALKFARTARWDGFTEDELTYLAAKAGLPERLVIATARSTVEAFREIWAKERGHLPLHGEIADVIDRQIQIVPLAGTR